MDTQQLKTENAMLQVRVARLDEENKFYKSLVTELLKNIDVQVISDITVRILRGEIS